jgi:hypothetical protein
LLVAVGVGSIVAILLGARALSAGAARVADLQTMALNAEERLAALRSKGEKIQHDLDLAEHQFAALASRSADGNGKFDPDRESTIEAWFARVKKLQIWFARRSTQAIPELRYLTDRDWILIGKSAAFDSEEHARQTLAHARSVAKLQFTSQLSEALRKYTSANGGRLPDSPSDLAEFSDPPLDDSALERYHMVLRGTVSGANASVPAIQETAPIDPEYDSRITVQAGGGWSSNVPPIAWTPGLDGRIEAANAAYGRANNGATTGSYSALAPYFDPPLDSVTLEKLLKAERERQP